MLRKKFPANNYIGYQVVCKQALWGILLAGWEKEGEIATVCGVRISVLKKLMRNADCGDDMSNDVITLFKCLRSRLFPLRADWQKSDASLDEEPQKNWRWN